MQVGIWNLHVTAGVCVCVCLHAFNSSGLVEWQNVWRKIDGDYFKQHKNVRRRWRMKKKMIKQEEGHGYKTRRKDEFL